MRYLPILMAAASCAALCGCFGPRFVKSAELPRSEATVSIRKTRDAETRIDLAVKHLKQPEKLVPPGYLYVAWVRRDMEAPALNIGVLELDRNLNGELHALTPLNHFELFVTAESSPEIDKPTGSPLLWARYKD
jgi:hypothetical protein